MKFLLLIISALLLNISFAQSKVKVFSDDGVRFNLFVNGEKQTEEKAKVIVSNEFNQEFVRVRVKNNNLGIDVKKGLALEPGKVTTLMLVQRKGVYRLKYMGVSPMEEVEDETQDDLKIQEQNAEVVNDNQEAKNATEMENVAEDVTIDAGATSVKTTVTVTETVDGETTTTTTTSEVNMHVDHDEFKEFEDMEDVQGNEDTQVEIHVDNDEFIEFEGSGEEIPDAPKLHVQPKKYTDEEIKAFEEEKKASHDKDTVYIVKEVPAEEEDIVVEDPCDYVDADDLDDIIKHMDGEIFSSDKKNIAIQALKHRCFTTADLRKVMAEFSFDDEKYELAEWGYDRVLDPENYYKMLGDFTFSSTKDKLNDLMNE